MSPETRMTLLLRVKNQNDENAWREFENIYSNYLKIVFKYIKIDHSDASDLTQETLLYLWKELPNFDYNKEKGRFRGWLRRVAVNKAMNLISKRQNRKRIIEEKYFSENYFSEMEEKCENEWREFIAQQAWKNIKDQISEIAGDCFMKMASGRSSVDIAKELDIPENTVRVYKRRVEKKINAEIRFLINEYD